jgi:hypothetical protein
MAGVVVSTMGVYACSLGFDADRYRGGVGGSGGGMAVGGAESCFEPRDCELPTPCWVATCVQQRCVLTPLPPMINLPAEEQVVGDCQVLSCLGEGAVVAQSAPDPDLDTLECTDDICVDGTTNHVPKAPGTPCGNSVATMCDAAGVCTGCTLALDCGIDDECKSYTCTAAGTCTTHYVDPQTRLNKQDPGDCKERICNGQGAVVTITNQTDPPPDPDPMDCLVPVCQGEMPTFQPAPDGQSCGASDGPVCCSGSCCTAPNGCSSSPLCIDEP